MNELQQPEQNNSCLDASLLIARRDSELTPDESRQVADHIASCPDCAADERLVSSSGHEVYDLLATLDPQKSAVPEPTAALASVQARLSPEDGSIVFSDLKQPRPQPIRHPKWYQRPRNWAVGAVAAVLIALLLLPNAGAFAEQFLSIFRVQQFQAVRIDPQSFRSNPLPNISDFGDAQINGIGFNGAKGDQGNLTEAQAQRLVHFHILLPSQLPKVVGQQKSFAVIQGGTGTFTFSAAKTRAYLARHGHSNVTIPANLNGAKFIVSVADGVQIQYNGQGSNPFMVVEIPSPTIRSTGNVSLNDLRDFLLSLPDMPPQLVAQLRQIDLNSGTIPIPVPPQVTAQHVTIHGAPGLLLADNTPIGGLLIWQTHGMIYAVGGLAGNATQLLDAANSLR